MKFVYFATVSVAVIAQAASAQVPPMNSPITNQAVTIRVVTPKNAFNAPASVTLSDGVVWKFDVPNTNVVSVVTVAGVKTPPGKLTAGMSCVLNGTQKTINGNLVTSLAC